MTTTISLRDYQKEAVDAVWGYWDRAPAGASPLVVLPTGSGKSVVLGETVRRLVEDHGCRVVVATHRAELIVQDTRAIRSVWPAAPVGIWSAGLGRTEYREPIVVCGVQTAANRPAVLGRRDVMIVDEAHLVSTAEATQYGRLIGRLREHDPDLRLVGYTATPYRLDQGYLTQGKDALFTSVCIDVPVSRLVSDGWLSPVVTGAASAQVDLSSVGVKMGEFAARDLELASDVDEVNDAVIADVARALGDGRTSAMVFGVSVAHARRLRGMAQMAGFSCEVITGETDRRERDQIIARFKAREVKVLASCDVLTTGFDAPVVDVIALVRATMSPSLYVQMVGRGMRLADGKRDCLLLDYGGNIARHGPIDAVRVKPKGGKGDGAAPVKTCPQCMAQCATASRACDHCGYEWPAPERKANKSASSLPAMIGAGIADAPKAEWHDVGEIRWTLHRKRGNDDAPATLRIDYYAPALSELTVPQKLCSEWLCYDHEPGEYAWRKAQSWWAYYVRARAPKSVEDAIGMLDAGWAPSVTAVEIMPADKAKGEKFPRVVNLEIVMPHLPGGADDERSPEDKANGMALKAADRIVDGQTFAFGDNVTETRCVCAACGVDAPALLTTKIDENDRRLFWLECRSCGKNALGKGRWLPHESAIVRGAVKDQALLDLPSDDEDLPF